MSNKTTAAPTNWAQRTKDATKKVPLENKNSKDRGTRHEGLVETFIPKSYSTGSFGVQLRYSVAGLSNDVYENIILKKMGTDGNLEATKYGEASLKRRLAAFGMTAEEISAFPIPRSPKDESPAYDLAGAPVVIYLADREYMGKTYKDVKSVWPVDNE